MRSILPMAMLVFNQSTMAPNRTCTGNTEPTDNQCSCSRDALMQGNSDNTASPSGVLDQQWTSLRRSQWHLCPHLSDIVSVAHLSLQSLRDGCFLILHTTHVSCCRICVAFSGATEGAWANNHIRPKASISLGGSSAGWLEFLSIQY